jgi:hypothetical protein
MQLLNWYVDLYLFQQMHLPQYIEEGAFVGTSKDSE